MIELFEHQKKIINDDPEKTLLALGTGSGKTRIALLLARGKTLVICPKTQRDDKNWEREAQKLNLSIDLTVISKETFRRDHESLKRYDTVILEEAHTCLGVTPNIRWVKKQPRPKASQLFEAIESFIERTKPDRLYIVTATIIKNAMTVWGAGKLLGKNWNFYEWRQAFYMRLPMPGREVWVHKTDSATKDRLAGIVQKLGYTGRLSDYFDVPDQTYKTIFLDLTEKQKKRLRELPLEYPEPIVLLGKKHQVENGILSGDEFSEKEIFDNSKIDTIIDLAEEFPRLVVFARYIAQINEIAKAMKQIGKKVFILTGDTKNRGELIKEANQCTNGVFIAQSSVSAGWELPEWEVMVFASLSYSIVDRIQAEGRILRANNIKKNLFIDLVMKGGIDEAVFNCINTKKDFDARVYLKL